MENADFSDAYLDKVIFIGAYLSDVTFDGTTLLNCEFNEITHYENEDEGEFSIYKVNEKFSIEPIIDYYVEIFSKAKSLRNSTFPLHIRRKLEVKYPHLF